MAIPDRMTIISINPNGDVRVDGLNIGLGSNVGIGSRFDLIYGYLGYFGPTFDPAETDVSVTPGSLARTVAATGLFIDEVVTGIHTRHSGGFTGTVTTYYWGLYDVNGNQLGVTANRTAAGDITAGRKSFDLTSPVTITATDVYYLVKTSDHTASGASYISCSITPVNNLAAAARTAGGKVRAGTAGSGSTLPATITIPTTASTVGIMWAACY
jgi:hypothetical protein